MRNDLDGEARRLRAAEECAISDTIPPWGCVWAARGEEARCNGSGDEEPEREDIGCILCRVVVSFLHFWSGAICFVVS